MKLPKSNLSVLYHNLSDVVSKVLEVLDLTFGTFTSKSSSAKFQNSQRTLPCQSDRVQALSQCSLQSVQ